MRADTKVRPYKNTLTLTLPEGEGIHYYCFIQPRAYALGYTHAAP